MIIKKFAFGNNEEAFIENRFKDSINLIFSDDNNRGKTLVMQGLIYSIGYDSIFPSGFNNNNYYFYSEILIKEKNYEFLRKGNSILLLSDNYLQLFNSISEFKYFFDKNIYELPKIEKNGELKPADLSLFYELFFLGQDRRNTSNLIVKGRNNKQDFKNMIFAMEGVLNTTSIEYDISDLKDKQKALKLKIKSERKKISIIKKNPELASFISSAANNIEFQNTSAQLKESHQRIAELRNKRTREENRRFKLESLITELNSLNRSLKEGNVKCADCGSENIIFANKEFEFEVSNTFVRKSILNSIEENITIKKDIVEEFNQEILKEQTRINKLLKNSTTDEKNYILFEDAIIDSKEIDKIVSGLQEELKVIEKLIENSKNQITANKDFQKEILENILFEMRRYYDKIDPQGKLNFLDLFTKNDETYSGSEGQEYYFCKLMALSNILNHEFPIIVDSFREGELSSRKEELMIEEFLKLEKQIILTSTLKKEEYISDKYSDYEEINILDYSSIEDSKILQSDYIQDFIKIVEKFGIET